jgi:phosphate transport system substrate-binding protein
VKSVAFLALFASLAVSLSAQDAVPVDGREPANAGVSIWTNQVTTFRKQHGLKGGYTKQWDLSDLPHYVPAKQIHAVLHIYGNNYIKDGVLAELWRQEFHKFQPGITLDYHLPTATIAIPALATGSADLGVGYKARLTDNLVFEQVYHHPVTEIMAMTGSYDVYGWEPATIVVVNKDNPLSQISMKQLDGVFGGARSGGYVGSVWHTEYPYSRGPEENIRTWGQLGLTGEWANQPIHIGGQNLTAGASYQFQVDVLRGSYQFAEGYRSFTNYITTDNKINPWTTQALRGIAKDRYAIYYFSPLAMGPEVKELAIQGWDGGPYVKRSLESVRSRTYPLTHTVYLYFNREPGQPIEPKVEEFVRFILSQEGQQCVQREGRYIPMIAKVVNEQLQKLR